MLKGKNRKVTVGELGSCPRDCCGTLVEGGIDPR